MDRIFVAANSQSAPNTFALRLLELVAIGHVRDLDPGSEGQAGIPTGILQRKKFTASTVREYAFQKIGESKLRDSVEFLMKLKQSDIGPDPSERIWLAAQVALANARLNEIADSQLKLQFLERTAGGRSPATFWAIEQLCNGGHMAAIVLIEKYIKETWSGQYGEDQIQFCQARMQVVSRNLDRVKALGSVLTLDSGADNDRLVKWAIHQLSGMDSAKAEAELKRFVTEIEKASSSSTQKQRIIDLKYALESEQRSHRPQQ